MAFRCAASCEPTRKKEYLEPLSDSITRAEHLMEKIQEAFPRHTLQTYLSGSSNFRKRIYPEYKAHRTKPPPTWLMDTQTYLITNWGAEVCDGYEADDALGIAATEHHAVIATIDKDLLQVPGVHYNLVRETLQTVDANEADLNFWCLMLEGDVADNIIGVHGIGKVKAKKYLEHETDRSSIVMDLYDDYARYAMNYNLIRVIRTREELAIKTKNENTVS